MPAVNSSFRQEQSEPKTQNRDQSSGPNKNSFNGFKIGASKEPVKNTSLFTSAFSTGIMVKEGFSIVTSAAMNAIGLLDQRQVALPESFNSDVSRVKALSPVNSTNEDDCSSMMDLISASPSPGSMDLDIFPPFDFPSERSGSINSNLSGTPTRNPLDMPEILHIVFEYLATSINTGTDPNKPLDFVKIDSIKYAVTKPKLHSCVLVNKLWNACATKLLWKDVKIGHEMSYRRFCCSLESQLRLSRKDSTVCFGPHPTKCLHHKGLQFISSPVNGWQYGLLIKSFSIIPPHGSFDGIGNWNFDQIVTALALSCPNLEELNLSTCSQVSDKALVLLARHCTKLKKLNLNRCDLVSDLTLIELAKNCKNLEIVNFSRPLQEARSQPSDKAMSAIVKERPFITEIRLRNCNALSDSTVIELAKSSSKHLKAVDLSWCHKLTDNSLIHGLAAHCPNLISVALNGCKRLTDRSLDALLENCGHIASLSLAHLPFITDDILTRMSGKLKNLQILSLNGCGNISDSSIVAIARSCPNLQSLSLYTLPISDQSVIEIAANCKNLISLSISGCTAVTDLGAQKVAALTNLQSLYLNGADITDLSVIKIVEQCPYIRALSLNDCRKLTDTSIICLSRYSPRLQSLSMNGCGASAVGIKEVVEHCQDLRELSIRECPNLHFNGPFSTIVQQGNGGMIQFTAIGEQVYAQIIQKRIALLWD